jgi:hypothetical protein
LSNGSKDTVLTKLNETEAKSFEDIENIISEGILEDKEINTGYLGVAEKISSIKLAIDIFVREIETSKKFPIELLRLVNYIVAEISCYYDSEKLTESEIVEIFRSSLSTYIQWNAEDRQSSMEVQLSRIVPPIVRAFACESSKSENPSVKKITEYFRNRNELVGVEMPGIETFEQNLVQSIEQNRPVKIMVKVCPSRRPKRLLDPETVPEFYETNPYMSDVAKLMLVTQEIIWKTKNSGFEVELEYVIMATDERDYLPPLKPYLGYSKGEGRMSTIQDRLDILSRNIVTFASICLPGVKVSIGQIEEYEEIDYRNGDYLEQYSRDLMQVAKEILVSDDPIIKKTLDENEKKYIERFSNGLYKQFADETIDYRLIAALRIATYSGQAKRLIRNGDIVLDTAEEPSTGRLRTFGIDPKSKIDPLSFAYASYGDREGFSKKLYKYKER